MKVKKSRGLKNRTPIANAIRTDLAIGLQDLSEKTRIPKSKLLDEALEDLLTKYKKPLR